MPKREIRMRLADAAESFAWPGPHLRPPRTLDDGGDPLSGEPIEFAVPASVADPSGRETALTDYTFDDATWTLTIHEAMPGHGMHYACVLSSGLSRVRTALDDNIRASVEGWAQYAEAELRPDLPVGAQLVALQQRLLRAARAFLDPGLHLGRVTAVEALRVLTREVGASKALARQEGGGWPSLRNLRQMGLLPRRCLDVTLGHRQLRLRRAMARRVGLPGPGRGRAAGGGPLEIHGGLLG